MMNSKILIFVFVATISLLPACNFAEQSVFQAKLSANPSELLEGQKSKITVIGQNFPNGLTYQWSVSDGVCNPQKSSAGETVYEAPVIESPGGEESVTIVAEFYLDGEKQGEESLTLKIKRRDPAQGTQRTGTSPETISPISRISTQAPKIEITKSGRLDFQGGQLYGDMIEGRVAGVDPKEYRVVLYTLSSEGIWYVQPYLGDGRFTEIQDNNLVFMNTYHTGVKYAALLCRRSYDNPPGKTLTLPLDRDNIVAFSVVDGVQR
jgi:hypothetical protein